MSEIDELVKRGKEYQVKIDEVSNLRLGMMLKSYYYNTDKDTRGNFIKGVFSFSINPHSTGIGVQIHIIKPDKSLFEIVHTTYWYNEGQYGFNSSVYLTGAWDEALNKEINNIKGELILAYKSNIDKLDNKIELLTTALSKELEEVNNMFKENK